MTRIVAMIAATSLFAVPALAGSYAAKPLAAPVAKTIVGKDISWSCGAGSCRGSTESSRPLVLCQDLAKRAGRIESFVADGHPLAADDLAKCNASAKGGTTELAKVN